MKISGLAPHLRTAGWGCATGKTTALLFTPSGRLIGCVRNKHAYMADEVLSDHPWVSLGEFDTDEEAWAMLQIIAPIYAGFTE